MGQCRSPEYYHRSMLSNAAPAPRGDKEAHQEGEAAMTTDDITSMVSTLFNALTGSMGEAARREFSPAPIAVRH